LAGFSCKDGRQIVQRGPVVERIVEAKYRGSGTVGDPFVAQWLDHDPENPKSYSTLFKWLMTFLLAFMTLCVSLASSAYTGAAGLIIPDFQ
jgi:hypothetical protein